MKFRGKLLSMTVLAVLITSLLTGCTGGGKIPVAVNNENPQNIGELGPKGTNIIKDGALTYSIVKEESLPSGIIESLKPIRNERGFVVIKATEGISTVCIGTGAKPSGGHSIVIKSITNAKDITNIIIEEVKPAPTEISTMQIMYPSIIINVKGLAHTVQVTTVDKLVLKGMVLAPTEAKPVASALSTSAHSIPAGKLVRANIQVIEGAKFISRDNNTIKVTVDKKDLTFTSTDMEHKLSFSKVKVGDNVRLFYANKDKGVLELYEIIVTNYYKKESFLCQIYQKKF